MASRRRGDTDSEKKVKPSEVSKVISARRLKALLADATLMKEKVDKLTGSHRSDIADAVEKYYLHKGAFSVVKRLNRLTPESLREWLDNFEHQIDASGLRARADSAPAMSFEEVDDIEANDRKNVRDFPAPRAEAAE